MHTASETKTPVPSPSAPRSSAVLRRVLRPGRPAARAPLLGKPAGKCVRQPLRTDPDDHGNRRHPGEGRLFSMLSPAGLLLDLRDDRESRAARGTHDAACAEAAAMCLLRLRRADGRGLLPDPEKISAVRIRAAAVVWRRLLSAAPHLYVGDELERYDFLSVRRRDGLSGGPRVRTAAVAGHARRVKRRAHDRAVHEVHGLCGDPGLAGRILFRLAKLADG